jgi:hypothetical protein
LLTPGCIGFYFAGFRSQFCQRRCRQRIQAYAIGTCFA